MSLVLRAIERVSGASGHFTAWLVTPLILATVYDVGARYLFNAPTQWAYEVGYMMMGAHALLGMAYTLREGGHVRIDAFSQMFSQGTKAVIRQHLQGGYPARSYENETQGSASACASH